MRKYPDHHRHFHTLLPAFLAFCTFILKNLVVVESAEKEYSTHTAEFRSVPEEWDNTFCERNNLKIPSKRESGKAIRHSPYPNQRINENWNIPENTHDFSFYDNEYTYSDETVATTTTTTTTASTINNIMECSFVPVESSYDSQVELDSWKTTSYPVSAEETSMDLFSNYETENQKETDDWVEMTNQVLSNIYPENIDLYNDLMNLYTLNTEDKVHVSSDTSEDFSTFPEDFSFLEENLEQPCSIPENSVFPNPIEQNDNIYNEESLPIIDILQKENIPTETIQEDISRSYYGSKKTNILKDHSLEENTKTNMQLLDQSQAQSPPQEHHHQQQQQGERLNGKEIKNVITYTVLLVNDGTPEVLKNSSDLSKRQLLEIEKRIEQEENEKSNKMIKNNKFVNSSGTLGKNVDKKTELVNNIVYLSLGTNIVDELHKGYLANVLFKTFSNFQEKKMITYLNTYRNSECALKNVCYFIMNTQRPTLSLKQCQNAFDSINSIEFLKLFISLCFVTRCVRFVQLKKKIPKSITSKEKIFGSLTASMYDFLYKDKRSLKFMPQFLIPNDGSNIESIIMIMKYILFVPDEGESCEYENLKNTMDEIHKRFNTIFPKFIKLNELFREFHSYDKKSFEQKYKHHKSEGAIGVFYELLNNIEKTQSVLKEIIRKRISQHMDMACFLYYNIGYFIIKRILLDLNDAPEGVIVFDCFQIFFKVFQNFLISEEKVHTFQDHLNVDYIFLKKKNDLLYVIFLHLYLEVIHFIFCQIKLNVNSIVASLDKYVDEKCGGMMGSEYLHLSHYSNEISKFGIMALSILSNILKDKEYLRSLMNYNQIVNSINHQIEKIMITYEKMSQNNKYISEMKKKIEALYEELLPNYKKLMKMKKELEE